MSGGAVEYISQASLMSFAPINRIHQHLHGFHCYASDRTRAVGSHHFCSCTGTEDLADFGVRQCVLYDSDKPDAKLIGVEYIVSEKTFLTLPTEEKRYWHSHKYEVESGQLVLCSKSIVPTVVEDVAERDAMKMLHTTYGKTFHTWNYDLYPTIPLGPPHLMMAFTGDGQISDDVVAKRDEALGINAAHKRENRASYIDTSYQVKEGADSLHSGKAPDLEFVEKEVKIGLAEVRGPSDVAI